VLAHPRLLSVDAGGGVGGGSGRRSIDGREPVAIVVRARARHSGEAGLDLLPEGVDAGIPRVGDLLEGLLGLALLHLEARVRDRLGNEAAELGCPTVSMLPARTSVGAVTRGSRSVVSWSANASR
jgi:hypothetical protein